jgi:hypothetical protein
MSVRRHHQQQQQQRPHLRSRPMRSSQRSCTISLLLTTTHQRTEAALSPQALHTASLGQANTERWQSGRGRHGGGEARCGRVLLSRACIGGFVGVASVVTVLSSRTGRSVQRRPRQRSINSRPSSCLWSTGRRIWRRRHRCERERVLCVSHCSLGVLWCQLQQKVCCCGGCGACFIHRLGTLQKWKAMYESATGAAAPDSAVVLQVRPLAGCCHVPLTINKGSTLRKNPSTASPKKLVLDDGALLSTSVVLSADSQPCPNQARSCRLNSTRRR